MVKRKIQIRIEPVKELTSYINHDFRIKNVEYLRNNMYHNKFKNLYISSLSQLKEIKKCANGYFFKQKKIKQKIKYRNYKRIELNSGLIGIITLSPFVNTMLKDSELSYNELNGLFHNALKNVIKKIMDICDEDHLGILYYAIHYDEKTPHLHFMMRNFLSNGNSLFGVVRNSKRMSELQDVVALPFHKIGFERGEKKSKEKHLTVVQMHEAEIQELIKEKVLIKKENKLEREAFIKENNDMIKSLERRIQNLTHSLAEANKIINDNQLVLNPNDDPSNGINM